MNGGGGYGADMDMIGNTVMVDDHIRRDRNTAVVVVLVQQHFDKARLHVFVSSWWGIVEVAEIQAANHRNIITQLICIPELGLYDFRAEAQFSGRAQTPYWVFFNPPSESARYRCR